MLRVWSEHLPFDIARDQDHLALLARHRVHPLYAVRDGADLDALAHLLRDTQQAGLEAGIWPLLPDADGYWPSERNVTRYLEHVSALLDDLASLGAKPQWVAVDLEPPLWQVTQLKHRLDAWWEVTTALGRENLDAARFETSTRTFEASLHMLHTRGARTLAVTVPMAAHDLRDGVPLWQDMFEAPWAEIGWDRAGIMAYGSMVSGYSRGWLSEADARAIHYRLFLHLARHFGARAHASLGVTGVGKLGDEPVYTRPAQLGLDAAAARAAGVQDLALFCWEGLVGREDAGAWLEAMALTPALTPPMTPKARALRVGGALARRALTRLR